jgi:hypothetical protein
MPLDPQRTLLIGIPANAIPVRTSKFFDAFNVSEFQLAAWNAETFDFETQMQLVNPLKAIIIHLSTNDPSKCMMKR